VNLSERSTAPARRHDRLPGFVGLFEEFSIATNRMVEANDSQLSRLRHVQDLFVVVNRICIYVFETAAQFLLTQRRTERAPPACHPSRCQMLQRTGC
jgi:hypothetical protein